VAAVAVPLLVLFLHVGDEALEAMGRSATLTGRTDIWKLVLKVPGNRLIGTGFESFWLGDRLESIWGDTPRARLNEAHNGYLEVLLNLGWIGVALLGVLLVTGYRNAMAALRRDPDTGGLKLAYFLVAVIFSFTEAGFRMMTPVWIFFLWATIAVPGASASAPIRARRVAAPNKAGSQAALSLEQA
jgi:O-antigen ligase